MTREPRIASKPTGDRSWWLARRNIKRAQAMSNVQGDGGSARAPGTLDAPNSFRYFSTCAPYEEAASRRHGVFAESKLGEAPTMAPPKHLPVCGEDLREVAIHREDLSAILGKSQSYAPQVPGARIL